MSDTQNEVFGCFSSIRNHLFCTCKLTRCPSDVKKEVNEIEVDHSMHLNTKQNVVSVSPGIVARLMGLDSMPESNWVPKESNPDSVSRSRSVNSIAFWSEFDPVRGAHRRIKTSLTFQEMPTFFQVTNNEFLLVKSENVCGKKQPTSNERKHAGAREGKQGGAERTTPTRYTRQSAVQKKEKKEKQVLNHTGRPTQNAATAVPSPRENNSKKPIGAASEKNTKQVRIHYKDTSMDKGPCSRKKDRAKSQLGNSHVQSKMHSSAKEDPRQRCSKLQRKQQLDFLDSKFPFRRHLIQNGNSVNRKIQSKRRCTKSTKLLKAKGYTYKLVYEELESFISKQGEMSMMESIEEIGTEFGLRILEGLVHEVVAELCGLPLQNLGILLMEDASNSQVNTRRFSL